MLKNAIKNENLGGTLEMETIKAENKINEISSEKGAAWSCDERVIVKKNKEPFGSFEKSVERLREKLKERIRHHYKNDTGVVQIVASTGLGKTYSTLSLIKENYETFVERSGDNFKVIYISPYLNTNYQAEKLVKELGLENHVIVVSLQSIAHKLQHLLKEKANEIVESGDISVNDPNYEYNSVILKNNLYLQNSYNRHTNLFKRYGITLDEILPQKVIDKIKQDPEGFIRKDHYAKYIDTIIIDEIHDVHTVAQMELNKNIEAYRTLYGIYRDLLEVLYESMHEDLAFSINDHLYAKKLMSHVKIKHEPNELGKSALLNKDVNVETRVEYKPIRVLLLTATPPVHTMKYSELFIIPKEYRQLDIDLAYDLLDPKAIIDYDFDHINDYIGYLDKLVSDLYNHNKVMIYFNNKQQLELLKEFLQSDANIRYTSEIITIHSDKDYVEEYMDYIKNTDRKLIILATKVIATGFDSDIDRVYFYSLKTNREELLQTIGRIRGKNTKVTFVLTLDDILVYKDKIHERFSNVYNLLDIYYTITKTKEELAKELQDYVEDINKKIKQSQNTNALTSQFTKFLLLEPFTYIKYSKHKSYPITMIRNIHFGKQDRVKYEVNKTVIDKMYKNLSIIDLPYEIIPKVLRKKFFAYDDNNFISEYLESYRNFPDKSDRFVKNYTNINSGSYRTLLDKLMVSLVLNSMIHDKNSITNNRLSRAERKEIKYDIDTELHFFETKKGYKVFPISLSPELINYLRNELPKLKLLNIQRNIENAIDNKNLEFRTVSKNDDLRIFENFDEVIDAVLCQKGFERIFTSRSVMLYEHRHSKTLIILYANMAKMFRVFSDDITKLLYHKHILKTLETNKNAGTSIVSSFKKMITKAYRKYNVELGRYESTINVKFKYKEDNISNKEVEVYKEIGDVKPVYEFLEDVVFKHIKDTGSFYANAMFIKPDMHESEAIKQELSALLQIMISNGINKNNEFKKNVIAVIDYFATKGNILDYVDRDFYSNYAVKYSSIRFPHKLDKEKYEEFGKTKSKEFTKTADNELLAAYIANLNTELFLQEYELVLSDLDNVFNKDNNIAKAFSTMFDLLIAPYINIRLIRLQALKNLKKIFKDDKHLVDNYFGLIQDRISSFSYIDGIKKDLVLNITKEIKETIDNLIQNEEVITNIQAYASLVLDYVVSVIPVKYITKDGKLVKFRQLDLTKQTDYNFFIGLIHKAIQKLVDDLFTNNYLVIDNTRLNANNEVINTFIQTDFLLDISASMATRKMNEILDKEDGAVAVAA